MSITSDDLDAAQVAATEIANDFAQRPITTAHLVSGMLWDGNSRIAQVMEENYDVMYEDTRAVIASMYELPFLYEEVRFEDRLTDGAKSALSLMEERLGEVHEASNVLPTEQLLTAILIQCDQDCARMLAGLHIERDELLAHIDPTAVPVD